MSEQDQEPVATSHARCRTCDARIEVRADDVDAAVLEVRGRAKQLGWRVLRAMPGRQGAHYICPACAAAIRVLFAVTAS